MDYHVADRYKQRWLLQATVLRGMAKGGICLQESVNI